MKGYMESFPMVALDKPTSERVFKKWLSIFCPDRKGWNPTRPNSEYLWGGEAGMRCHYQCDAAIEQYQDVAAPSYYILPNDYKLTYDSLYLAREKPEKGVGISDFFVFPKNYAWCMAFTHEDGWIGPIFTKHKDFIRLNKVNLRAVENMVKHNT
ncbi:hypothetical protein ACFSJ3_16580 [Corallincola platygyrae]|uniref:DUF4275 family protein n=1 Tax=Corallincola platygyrae TaxID=1193278 RepID=A0ABW4XR92_9GAMM